jgi:hypothetical protein
MRLQDENFVSGSGFSGCDHYDHGYDNGLVTDRKRDWCFQDDMLAGFLVEDDVVEEDSSTKKNSTQIWIGINHLTLQNQRLWLVT